MVYKMKHFITLITFTILIIQNKNIPKQFETIELNEIIAFPGAEGFGKYTTGGRGGMVYIVTNLNDSGIGSLRWALEAKGPRTVIFEVSGNIELKSRLNLEDGNLTIAGQTAPGEGITVLNFPIRSMGKNNVIIRFLRFRLGDGFLEENDSFEARKGKHLIIDHCSFSWGVDETCSIYDFENSTVQNCIFSESLNKSFHEKGNHGYGSIWGGKNVSFYKNLMAHFVIRVPSISTGSRLADLRNNVIFNWSFRATNNGNDSHSNLVNNYYKPGPATIEADEIHVQNHFLFPTGPNYGKFYLEGNKLVGRPEVDVDQWKGVRLENSNKTQMFLEDCKNKNDNGELVPFPIPHGLYPTETTAEQAYKDVLSKSGASLFRDAVDERIVYETETGTTTYKGSKTGLPGIIDSQKDVGGWPQLKSTTPPLDTDRDGMPDEWEIANGLDPNSRDDRFYDLDEHYTNLEVYINSLVQHIIE